MKKIVVWHDEHGNRQATEFDVGGKRKFDGLKPDKNKEVDSIVFIKSVDYKASYFVEV
jgi:hypothetical protein